MQRSMIDPASANRLVAILQEVRKRPSMYLVSMEMDAAIAWLNGFQMAYFALFGGDGEMEAREKVVEARGWHWSARHYAEEMRECGLAPGAIFDELLAIEIDVLRSLGGE